MRSAHQPPPERRNGLLALALLLLACVAVNWRLGQRQDELEEGWDHSLQLLERYARRIPNERVAANGMRADSLIGAADSWAEGLRPIENGNASVNASDHVSHWGSMTRNVVANETSSATGKGGRNRRHGGGSSNGADSSTRAKSNDLRDGIKARVAAVKEVSTSRMMDAVAGVTRRAAGRVHGIGREGSHVVKASGSKAQGRGSGARPAHNSETEPEREISTAPIPDEVISFEKQAELSEMARNFHSLIKSAEGRVTRCKGPRSEERPSIESLPLQLTRYISYNDVFVHQGNYRRLLGHGNFTQLKYPRLLPESAAKLYERFGFDSCAVVGNSGALLYAKFGPVIDKHDVVFRLNQAPTKGYNEFVGKRTTFRLLNSLWTHRYSTMRKRDDMSRLRDFIWGDATSFWKTGEEQSLDATQLPLERGAALIVSRCSAEEYGKLLKFWYSRRPDVMVLMLNSRLVSVVRALMQMYRKHLCAAGWGPFEGGADPTSGLVASYIALHLCRLATVYGFGSERITEDKQAHTPYHYYKFYGARHYGNSKAHSFDTELNMMAQLYNHTSPHPFRGHWRYDPGTSVPGNARMCRTEKGYIANVHNLHCRGGWDPPSHGEGMLRAEGPVKLEEYKQMQERHRMWNIPLADVEMPNTKSKPAKWMKAMNLPLRGK